MPKVQFSTGFCGAQYYQETVTFCDDDPPHPTLFVAMLMSLTQTFMLETSNELAEGVFWDSRSKADLSLRWHLIRKRYDDDAGQGQI